MAAHATSHDGTPWFRETELFTSGAEGYHTFRIPAMVVANDGTLLAFCEGRSYGQEDYQSLYLVLKRSTDNGVTWEPMQVVAGDGTRVIHNPCAVVDRETGTIWLTFCADGDLVYVTSSTNGGADWTEPVEITGDVKAPSWTTYWTGPGHGIQLKSGTLLIPCYHVEDMRRDWIFLNAHLIYSDDHGSNWKLGGTLAGGMDESQVVETHDGSLYLAVRNAKRGLGKRVCAWSGDAGVSWSDATELDELPDPNCKASIARFTDQDNHDKNRVLFSNCASTTRDTMTVRISYDECKTWAVSKVLYPAYSDLAVASDMTICCLYERGVSHPYESIRLAQFNLEWLTDGADHVT